MPGAVARHFDTVVGVVLVLVCLVAYGSHACPTVYWYDSAEYAAAAATLGIPHPPGYPLYTLVAHVFTWLPMEPARAVNLMSSTFGALTVGTVYAVGRALGARPTASGLGALSLASAPIFFGNSLVAEVYTPALFVALLVLWLLLRGRARGQRRLVVLAAFVAGLGLGMHLFVATCGLGYALLVLGFGTGAGGPRTLAHLARRDDLGQTLRLVGLCLLATFVGSLIYLYIPLRAASGPAVNVNDPSTWERFWWVVTGGNYRNWFLKEYDLGQRLWGATRLFWDQLGAVGALLAGAGLWALGRRDVQVALALVLAAAGNIWFFIDYNVHDLPVFLLPAVAMLACAIPAGAQWALDAARVDERRTLPRTIVIAALWGYGLLRLWSTRSEADLSEFTEARDYGEQLARELPKGAVIVNFTTPPEWQRDAVFRLYFREVLGERRDVEIVTLPPPEWLVAQVRSGRPVYFYVPVPMAGEFVVMEPVGVAVRAVAVRERPPR